MCHYTVWQHNTTRSCLTSGYLLVDQSDHTPNNVYLLSFNTDPFGEGNAVFKKTSHSQTISMNVVTVFLIQAVTWSLILESNNMGSYEDSLLK